MIRKANNCQLSRCFLPFQQTTCISVPLQLHLLFIPRIIFIVYISLSQPPKIMTIARPPSKNVKNPPGLVCGHSPPPSPPPGAPRAPARRAGAPERPAPPLASPGAAGWWRPVAWGDLGATNASEGPGGDGNHCDDLCFYVLMNHMNYMNHHFLVVSPYFWWLNLHNWWLLRSQITFHSTTTDSEKSTGSPSSWTIFLDKMCKG